MELNRFGWDSFFENNNIESPVPPLAFARVAEQHKNKYLLFSEQGEISGELSGKILHHVALDSLPTVGDWVAILPVPNESKGIIQYLLPRKNAIERKSAGLLTTHQALAANIDTLLIVCGLDFDFNLRRIERYLTMAYNCGVSPVIALNKSDLCDDPQSRLLEVEAIAPAIPVALLSAMNNIGLENIRPFLSYAKTVALVGSSGVGKSSIINTLYGRPILEIGEVRADDSRGRHTTTYRQMILLPDGAILIDTPGLRELQLWGDDDGLKSTFDDIDRFARQCRFSDCRHDSEPDCAVKSALENGELEPGRYESYLKLQRELKYLKMRQKMKPNAVEKLRWKSISKIQRKFSEDS